MNGKDIFMGLKYVGEDLIEEAETIRFPASSSGAHRRIRKPLLIAAIITLMVFLMGCAVVCLKMEQVKIGEAAAQQDYSLVDGVYVKNPHTVNTSALTMAGVEGTNAYQACADFYAFQEEYTADIEKKAAEGTLQEGYWDSGTYSETMDAKALALAEQYGLKPEGTRLNFRTVRNMCDALGLERFVRNSQEISADVNGGGCYDSGNFWLDMQFRFPEDQGYEVLGTSGVLYWNRQDCFSRDYVTIVESGDWVEQNYTTASGSDVLILHSPSQERGYILCNRGEALMTLQLNVNIELLSEEGGVVSARYQHMTQEQLELVADTVDFAIHPRIPTQADVAAQAEIPRQTTQNGFGLDVKSAKTDGYVAQILLSVAAPEGTVLPTANNITFSNYALTPASGGFDCTGPIEVVDDGDGKENTIDLLLVFCYSLPNDSAPFAAGTTWNLYLADIGSSQWDDVNYRLIEDTLAEGEWLFPITFDETNCNDREIELITQPVKTMACIGWKEDGTDVLDSFVITSFKLREFSSEIAWDFGEDNQFETGDSADFYIWRDHFMYAVMKDGAKIQMLGERNTKPIDLDQVDYILLADGTKLPVPEQ